MNRQQLGQIVDWNNDDSSLRRSFLAGRKSKLLCDLRLNPAVHGYLIQIDILTNANSITQMKQRRRQPAPIQISIFRLSDYSPSQASSDWNTGGNISHEW